MVDEQDKYNRVDNPIEVEQLLGALSDADGAWIRLERDDAEPQPVLVAEQRPGEVLVLDIGAVREIAGELRRGQAFRVLGRAGERLLRTEPIVAEAVREEGGRVYCDCPYPVMLGVLQRREAFRARLRPGMEVGVVVRSADAAGSVHGDLRDLSLGGCQAALPLSSGTRLRDAPLPLEVELCFPNGVRFIIAAQATRFNTDIRRHAMFVGFRFEAPSAEQERLLWQFVREIEREVARLDGTLAGTVQPSPLLTPSPGAEQPVGWRAALVHPTPMARRLARVAGYLDAQALELQHGGEVDPAQLSRHADLLLTLLDEDREAVLFATRCMHREPMPVRHGLAVAAHLVDLMGGPRVTPALRKAVAAAAMVHDLGKVLLPAELMAATALDAPARARLAEHVGLLVERLARCRWLAPSVVMAVVGQINERLDGSGYPDGTHADALGELARAAAVVDAVEAMRRARADRPPLSLAEIYRTLLRSDSPFDPNWVRRHLRHFGALPVGALVRYEGDRLAWVQRLDENRRPVQVELTDRIAAPETLTGEILRGPALARLGAVVEECPVDA